MADETPLPEPITPWFADKAVHAVLTFTVGMVANVIGRKFGYSMNTEEVVAFATVVLGFIAGHKWKSGMLQKAMIEKAGK